MNEQLCSNIEFEQLKQTLIELKHFGEIGLWTLDVVSGITEWDEVIRHILGVDDRFLGGPEQLCQLVHPADCESVQRSMQKAIEDGIDHHAIYRVINSDRWVECWAKPVFDSSGTVTHLSGFLRDISEKHRAELALLESEERFRRLAENSPDMIYRMSLPDGKYEYVSPASSKIFGYSPNEFVSSPKLMAEVIHPDWVDYFVSQWANLLRGIMPPTYEYQIVHKSGEVRWINQRNTLVHDESGIAIAIEGIVTDITDSKTNKERVKADSFFEIAGVMLVTLDHEGYVSRINRRGCEVLGYSREEIIGKDWFESFLYSEDKERVHSVYQQLMAGEIKPAEYFDNPVRTRNGQMRIITWHNTVLYDDAGEIEGILSSGEDVTV